jgi:hypothetical protein
MNMGFLASVSPKLRCSIPAFHSLKVGEIIESLVKESSFTLALRGQRGAKLLAVCSGFFQRQD